MPKIRLYVDTGFVGAEHEDFMEIPDDEWEKMTAAERDTLCRDAADEIMYERVECGWELCEEED